MDDELGLDARLKDLAEFRFRLRQFLSFSESCAETAGITAQHYQLLQVVGVGGAAGSSITEIAGRMLLRHNSAVELVDRAERAALVRRTSDQSDHRRSLVQMTNKGRAALNLLVGQHLAYLDENATELVAAVHTLLGGAEGPAVAGVS